LQGGGGNDTLIGGAGNDALDGGTGFNTADYSGAGAAVAVNLVAGTANDGQGGTDTLINIQVVVGTGFADTLTGGAGSLLTGNGGGDLLADGILSASGASSYDQTIFAQAAPLTYWQVAAAGDFTGDGKTDLFWENTAGGTYIYQMNGFAVPNQ